MTEETIGKLYVGAFLTTGQVCMAMKRLYVHRSHYDAVVEGLSGAVGAPEGRPGPARRRHDGAAEQRAPARLRRASCSPRRASGAEVRELAEAVDDAAFARGQFMRPSLVLDPRRDARIVTEEQFGPTLPIIPFDDEQDAIAPGQRHLVGAVLVGVVLRPRARRRASPPSCAPAPRSSTPTTRRSSTSARRSAASTRAAWAARWARRGSWRSPTRTRCRTRRSTAVRLSRMRGCRRRLQSRRR